MTRVPTATLILFLAATAAPFLSSADHMDSLVEAEREFARTARVKGWRNAFIEFFADDAIAFAPAPEPAKPRLRKGPARSFAEEELTWEPRVGDVAASGDLGWLTGPSVTIAHHARQPATDGNYVSIWKKQPDGRWRVFIDLGMKTPGPAPFEPGFTRMQMSSRSSGKGSAGEGKTTLIEQDNALNAAIAAEGPSVAYARHVAPGARLHRAGTGTMPAVGEAAIIQWFATHPSSIAATTTTGDVSAAGDLGYTYGSYTINDAAPGSYVRIWARDGSGRWLLQVDAIAPPKP